MLRAELASIGQNVFEEMRRNRASPLAAEAPESGMLSRSTPLCSHHISYPSG
jgi:hypothetical protein